MKEVNHIVIFDMPNFCMMHSREKVGYHDLNEAMTLDI